MGTSPSSIFPGSSDNDSANIAAIPSLWLGGSEVINSPKFFASRDIGWVLSVGPSKPGPQIPLKGHDQINLADDTSSDLGSYFRRIVLFIAEGRHVNRQNVYIHCQMGVSRSVTCLCAYLMAHLGLSYEEALQFVFAKRSVVCPNQSFRQQLRNFENSDLRKELAEELRKQCDNYDDLHRADLAAVQKVLNGGSEPCSPKSNDSVQKRRGTFRKVLSGFSRKNSGMGEHSGRLQTCY